MASPGKGAVLFLHAYPLDRSMWRPQAEAVREAGWMVVAPDFPGFGDAPYRDETTLEAFANRVVGVLESVEATRAVVVGLSMGGYAAFRLLESRPTLARALVLADTKAGEDPPERRAARLEQAERAEREGTGWLADAMLPSLLSEGADPAVSGEVRDIVDRAKPEAVAAALRAMAARPDSSPLLSSVSVPTLVIVGEHDKVTPPSESEAMARAIPGARLETIPNAGHLSNLENPEAFNRALLGFLEEVDARG